VFVLFHSTNRFTTALSLFKNAAWDVIEKLIEGLRIMHEKDEKTIDQEKYLSILVYSFESECWEDMLRMALQVPLLMHIGRLLCFDRIPNSGSEHIAASSYMLRVFCHALWLGSQAKNSFMLVIDDIGEPSKAFAHSPNPSEIKEPMKEMKQTYGCRSSRC